MRLEDYEKKTFEEFHGHYDRGKSDGAPEDYFSNTLNVDYDYGEWNTRNGLSTAIVLGYGSNNGKVRRFVEFADLVMPPIVLILDDVGNLYTFSTRPGDTATTPRITEALATDFSAIKFLGKIYIGFHDGEFGLAGKSLKVFIPHPTNPALDEFRNAAGLAPVSASPMIAINATEVFSLQGEDSSDLQGEDDSDLIGEGGTGTVNAGTYKIAVSYETTSGFITPPGPKIGGVFTPTIVTIDSDGKISLTNIPIGPAGTAKRRILVTQAGLNEYFILGSTFGGIINDNVTTTAILDFDDTVDLVESGDYLFDLLEVIPAPLGLSVYGGRLLTFGGGDSPSIVRASLSGQGEAFDSISGIIIVEKDDGFSVRNATVIRKVLYLCKNLGIYSITDNGLEPSVWGNPDPIDKSINVCIHGIGEFFDLSAINMARDWTLIADRSGILVFDGIARKPPITDNINNIWQTMNFAKYHKLVIIIDEQFHKIYCTFPTGSSTENNKVIMGDYNKCPGKIPESSTIKWSIWEFRPGNITKSASDIGLMGIVGIDTVPTFKIGSMDGGGRIWKLDPNAIDDNIVGVDSFTDNFNRANGHPNVGQTSGWQNDVTHESFFNIVSNKIRITGDSAVRPLPYSENITTLTDQFSELIFSAFVSGLPQGGVLVRSGGFVALFDRGYGLTVNNTHVSDKGVGLYRYFQSGPNYSTSFIIGATLSHVITAGDVLGLRMVGTTLTIYFNGVDLISATDTNYASGFPGMFEGGGTPSVSEWSNWRGGPYPPPTKGDIESYVETSLLLWEPGSVHIFAATRLRVIGTGIILCTISGEDNTSLTSIPSIPIATAPGKEYLIRFNFQNEKAKIKYRLTTGKFIMSKIEIFGKPIYSMRPA